MNKIYFVRAMKVSGGRIAYSVIDNKILIFSSTNYFELVSFLKNKLSYLNKLGVIMKLNGSFGIKQLEEDVYSYTY